MTVLYFYGDMYLSQGHFVGPLFMKQFHFFLEWFLIETGTDLILDVDKGLEELRYCSGVLDS